MAASRFDMEIEQGATFTHSFAVIDNGVPRNIAGAAITFKARMDGSPLSTPLDIDLAVGTGVTITDAPNGAFSISVTNVATGLLTPGKRYNYTLKIILGGVAQRLLQGVLTVSPEVV